MNIFLDSKKHFLILSTLILASFNFVAIAQAETLLIASSSASVSSSTKTDESEKSPQQKNVILLPLPPQTGTPEGADTPGGTREKLVNSCLEDSTSIRYVLRNNIRDFTVSSHPVFWFCLPNTEAHPSQLKFSLTETQTGRIVYQNTYTVEQEATIFGIVLPQSEEYALQSDVNYTWQLDNQNEEDSLILSGWIKRLSVDADLEQKLSQNSGNKYQVYLQENILYDALTTLISSYQTQPDNPQILEAWDNILKF